MVSSPGVVAVTVCISTSAKLSTAAAASHSLGRLVADKFSIWGELGKGLLHRLVMKAAGNDAHVSAVQRDAPLLVLLTRHAHGCFFAIVERKLAHLIAKRVKDGHNLRARVATVSAATSTGSESGPASVWTSANHAVGGSFLDAQL